MPADAPLGVDVGARHLAVLSTGEVVDSPKHLFPLCPAHGPAATGVLA